MANITKRVSKKGVVSYRIKVSLGYDENGKQVTKSCTWTPEPGMTERQIKKELDRQALIFEEDAIRNPKNSRRVKFRELSEEWLTLMETTGEMKRSTLERMKDLQERTYKFLGNTYVDDISYRQVQQFIVSIANRDGLSEKTQKHYLSFVSDVMRYAKRCGLTKDNPCKDISIVRTGSKEREVYTLEEESRLLYLLSSDNVPLKYRAFFELAIYCGLRRSEILGLEWKDIDFTYAILSVVRTSQYRGKETGTYTDTPKTKNSARSISVTPGLLNTLRDLKLEQNEQRTKCGDQWIETDRLFTQWNGAPIHPNTPYSYLQKLCVKNDIPFKGIHSFRHAFATNLITSNEVDIRTVSALMGHSQTSTTMNIYAHEVKRVSAKSMGLMANLLEKSGNNDHE